MSEETADVFPKKWTPPAPCLCNNCVLAHPEWCLGRLGRGGHRPEPAGPTPTFQLAGPPAGPLLDWFSRRHDAPTPHTELEDMNEHFRID